MKHHLWIVLSALSFVFLCASCGKARKAKQERDYWESPVQTDLEEIKRRGYIRAVVDNSSTSYYIYRGRRMGYEYELLRHLSRRLGVQLRIVVASDIDQAFYLLNRGQADIIAINLEETAERNKYARFTAPINNLPTVLVQRRGNSAIRNLEDLDGKNVHVRAGTVYKKQLRHLEDSLEIRMNIVEVNESLDALVEQVVSGDIDQTVVDKDLALVNATYYDDIDMAVEVSPASKVGWAVRTNSPDLLMEINAWIKRAKRSTFFAILYGKYFLNKKNSYFRSSSPFSSISGDRISVYDEIIKEGSEQLGWDWRLLASLVFKESKFDTTAVSYAGAKGLLQLMPVTLERFGVTNPNDPMESLMGGVRYLQYLDKFWLERVPETSERVKFILASYNVGHGHVEDAWRLAMKFGKDTRRWKSVAFYLERKSQPQYYRDPIVRSGYAKGHLAVAYVQDILNIYESYRVLVKP